MLDMVISHSLYNFKKSDFGGVNMSSFDWTYGRISLFDCLEELAFTNANANLSFYRGRLVAQDSSRLATGITETVGSIMWVDLLGWGWWKMISWRILSFEFESFAVFFWEKPHFEKKDREKDLGRLFFFLDGLMVRIRACIFLFGNSCRSYKSKFRSCVVKDSEALNQDVELFVSWNRFNLNSTFCDYRKETQTCCMPGFSSQNFKVIVKGFDSTLRCTSTAFS